MASGSSGNATMVSDGNTSLLLDAGISVNLISSGSCFTLSSTAGCLITHSHLDHSTAMKGVAKLGVNVYASQGTLEAVKATGHRFIPIKSLEIISIGTFKIMPFDVTHDTPEPLGFLIESILTGEKLIYFSDTAYVKYTFTGLTHIIAECNHGEQELHQSVKNGVIDHVLAKRIAKNHMSVERLAEFFKANDLSYLKQVYLIHLSDNNSHAEKFKETIQRVTGTEVYVF
jgi:phosphoribosyl 1,2-cyclic phosphodiesterase